MRIAGTYEDLIEQARQARASGQVGAAVALYGRVVDRLATVVSNTATPDDRMRDLLLTAADELQLVLDWAGDRVMAQALCRRMADVDAENRTIWLRRAATERIHAGEAEEGLADLRRLSAEEPAEFWHTIELAARLIELDRLDEAEAALEQAATQARDDEERGLVHWTRSRILRQRGQWQAAAQEWQAACRRDAFFRRAGRAMYRMFVEAGDYDGVLPYLSQEKDPLVEGYYRGVIAYRQGEVGRAQKIWRRVIQNKPADVESGWEAWALAQIRLGAPRLALDLVADLVRRGYTTEECYLIAALASALLGDLESAKTNLDIALRIRRQTFGPRALLPSDLWIDFEDLLADEAARQELRGFFAPAARG